MEEKNKNPQNDQAPAQQQEGNQRNSQNDPREPKDSSKAKEGQAPTSVSEDRNR